MASSAASCCQPANSVRAVRDTSYSSRRKAERFKMRLTAAGASPADLERVRSPMGLPINALTAAEIAISIVGELIALRRKDTPRR